MLSHDYHNELPYNWAQSQQKREQKHVFVTPKH